MSRQSLFDDLPVPLGDGIIVSRSDTLLESPHVLMLFFSRQVIEAGWREWDWLGHGHRLREGV